VKVKLKGINSVKKKLAGGGVATHYYHRATGRKLTGRPDSQEFVDSWNEAEKSLRSSKSSTKTFDDLITRFETSPYFDDLAATTREAYVWKLKTIRKRWGTCPVDAVQDKEFRRDAIAWRDQLGKKSRRSADNLLAAVARVLSFAKEAGEIDTNVLDTFGRIYKSDRSDKIWSDADVTKFLSVARPSMITAMYLVRNTGLRQKDLREMPWSAYDGVNITLRTSKGKKPIKTPCPLELKTYLDGLPRKGVLILTTDRGKAFQKRYFNECWREDCDKAEIEELNFHDCRGTAATALAEAGANISMIASIMGWTHATAQRIIDTYIARSGKLAAQGIKLLEEHRSKTGTNR
jgi:integrase